MAVVYPSSIINLRLQVGLTALDAGAGNAVLRVGTANMALVLSSITLGKPSAVIAGGVMTFLGLPKSDFAAAATGIPVSATISDSNGNIVISGLTVSNSSATNPDVLVSQPQINVGDTVTLIAVSQIQGR